MASCDVARAVTAPPIRVTERRLSVEIRLGLYEQPIASEIVDEALLPVWHSYRETIPGPWAVRSSALIEDRADANFAGQFESFLGIDNETDFLTAVRACWAALWTTNARRYMANHGLNPASTAMAVLIQPLVAARASGGGLERDRRRQHAAERDLGARLRDRAGRGRAGPDRAEPPGLRAQRAGRPQGPSRHLRPRPGGTAGGAEANWRASLA